MPPRPSLNFSFPTHACFTFNLNSLSAYKANNATKLAARHRSLVRQLTPLLDKNTIGCLQETNLGENDHLTINNIFKQHLTINNNLNRKEAGVAVCIPRPMLEIYKAHVLHLSPECVGRILAVYLSPRRSHRLTTLPLLIINVHFSSTEKTLRKQLRSLLRMAMPNGGAPPHTYLLGDLNFVECQADAPSPLSKLVITGKASDLWSQLKDKHNLKEIRQPLHTHYFLAKNIQDTRTSRIDRVYISHTEAEMSVSTPTSHIPFSVNNPVREWEAGSGPKPQHRRLGSDHLPVLLSFTPPPSPKHSRRLVPRWFADRAQSKEEILECWERHTHTTPYKQINSLKTAIRKAYNSFLSKHNNEAKRRNVELGTLPSAIRLLRSCSQSPPDREAAAKLLRNNPHLCEASGLDPEVVRRTAAHGLLPTDKLIAFIDDALYERAKGRESDREVTCEEVPLPPQTTPDSIRNFHTTLIAEIKTRLPSQGAFVTSLRRNPRDNPTSDRGGMLTIIKDFWSGVWAKRNDEPTEQETDAYLADYPCKIPREVLDSMVVPEADTIAEDILKTKNSSPGPDCIHFAFLRLFAYELAPLVRRIILDLAEGNPPPLGFNFGRLFLFPKNNSKEIKDTRPITISDTIYRVVARIVKNIMTEAVDRVVLHQQKGYIPGRQGASHVVDLTRAYYSSLSKKQQVYLLFLDTNKAFDSVDHTFIERVLMKIGVPLWLCNVVAGLMHEIRVVPFLGDAANTIRIDRGVKQGCPLSPLLFLLCFDVLLHNLTNRTGHTDHAFADDLAIATPSLQVLVDCLDITNTYARFSGLTVNLRKTCILTSLPPSDADKLTLTRAGYSHISFKTSVTYLGVLLGSNITTADIYRPAYNKFVARVALYADTLRSATLHQRIIIFNVFLLPLFYYLAQFYIIPFREIIKPTTAIAHKAVVAYGGKGFAYAHLVAPRSLFGPHTPLKDLWAVNMALLAQSFPLKDSESSPLPVLGQFAHVAKHSWNSLQVEEHRAWAAFCYLEDHAPRHTSASLLDTSGLGGSPKAIRARIYYDCVQSGYESKRHGLGVPASLPTKLTKFTHITYTTQHNPTKHLLAHRSLAQQSASPAVWNNQLKLVFNALPSGRRRRHYADPGDNTCFLCGGGEDSAQHLFGGDCPVVADALNEVNRRLDLSLTCSIDSHLLLLPVRAGSHPLPTLAMLSFNWAVWHQRTFFFALQGEVSVFSAAVNRLVEATLDSLSSASRPKQLGSSQQVVDLASSPPPSIIAVFTDGSARPNPGPAGAGLWLTTSAFNGEPATLSVSMSLGHGDNNLGEMVALLLCFLVLDCITAHYPDVKSAIFSDSLSCISYLLGKWPSPTVAKVARATRRAHKRCAAPSPPLYWVRGHSGFKGNVKADSRARKGASLNGDDPGVKVTLRIRGFPPSLRSLIDKLDLRRAVSALL